VQLRVLVTPELPARSKFVERHGGGVEVTWNSRGSHGDLRSTAGSSLTHCLPNPAQRNPARSLAERSASDDPADIGTHYFHTDHLRLKQADSESITTSVDAGKDKKWPGNKSLERELSA
jgi:hypothetical protein